MPDEVKETIDIVFNGIKAKQLICKTDHCRGLFGYEANKGKTLFFICRHCKEVSVFEFSPSKMKQEVDKLIIRMEGGEIEENAGYNKS